MTSLKETFTKAKSENRAVLIAYLPAGFPSLDGSIQIINYIFKNGVDVIEVGVP
ncbi:MAG: tryptophan synthase subunit alpha [Actinomycetes bacterium]